MCRLSWGAYSSYVANLYIHTHLYIYIYTYIYMYRGIIEALYRDNGKESGSCNIIGICIHIYIYMYRGII